LANLEFIQSTGKMLEEVAIQEWKCTYRSKYNEAQVERMIVYFCQEFMVHL